MKKVNQTKNNPVTKDTNLAELVHFHPESAEVLLDYGLHCIGCVASSFDTVEAGAKAHGLSDKDIEDMVLRINEVINFKE